MHITGETKEKVEALGCISDELGFFSMGVDAEGLIFEEYNIAPKLYRYKALDKNNNIVTDIRWKGMHKDFAPQLPGKTSTKQKTVQVS